MSVNKIHLNSITELKAFLKEYGSQKFYCKFVKRREVFIGPVAAINFVNNFSKKYEYTKETFYEV